MKKIISIILTIALMLSMSTVFAFADVASTPVSTKAEFLAMEADGTYHLTANIDLGALSGSYALETFSGTLDGKNHTVTYTVTQLGSYNGLIKILTGNVKNLNVNAKISGTSPENVIFYAGAIAARMDAPAIIDSCKVYGTADYTLKEVRAFIGGVAGQVRGTVTSQATVSNTHNTSDILISDVIDFTEYDINAGGITGAAGTISNCVNSGKITSESDSFGTVSVAGIAATESNRFYIEKSVNTGEISALSATQSNAAGIAAKIGMNSQSIISQCYNAGMITASLAGADFAGADGNNVDANNFYAAAGGIVAEANRTAMIYNVSNTGLISASTPDDMPLFANKSFAAGIGARVFADISKALDNHYGTITGYYCGPIYASVNNSIVTNGDVTDTFYLKSQQYNTFNGQGSDNYTVSTVYLEKDEAAMTTSYTNFKFTDVWKMDDELGHPVLATIPDYSAPLLPELLQGWVNTDNKWYFYVDDQPVVSDWVLDGGKWYYLGANGVMLENEWLLDGGKWYFLNSDGSMIANEWKKDSIGWVYLGANGAMVTDKWVKDSIGWCYVGANGYAVTNTWKKDSIGWCYLNSEGSMVKNNWVLDGGKWYFLDKEGYMVANEWKKDSIGWVYLGADGAMVTNEWVKDSIGWCYVGANGYAVTNTWKKDSIGWCYLGAEGSMVKNNWVLDGGKWYFLDKEGYMVTGKQTIGGKVYTFNSNGVWIA